MLFEPITCAVSVYTSVTNNILAVVFYIVREKYIYVGCELVGFGGLRLRLRKLAMKPQELTRQHLRSASSVKYWCRKAEKLNKCAVTRFGF